MAEQAQSDQSSGVVYERLLRGEADPSEYVAALRREARGGRIELKGWPARWAGTVVRAREAEASRDRYWQALVDIAGLENWQNRQAGDIARDALAPDEVHHG